MFIEKVLRRIGLSTVIGSVLCLSMCGNAYAKYARLYIPDLDEIGSIYVEMRASDTGELISGGTMTLYMIGRYEWWNSMYQFRVEPEFTEDIYSHYIDFDMLNDKLVNDLLEYAYKNDIEGETKAIGDSGSVIFKSLEPGLYLLAQKEPAEGYYSISPFFVTLPLMNVMIGIYEYDVNATPKMQKLEPIIQPAPLEPAYHDWAELEPANHNWAELEPAYHDWAELEPANHNWAELEPAYTKPAELTPAFHNPAESESITSPDTTQDTSEMTPPESEPETATPSDADHIETGRPTGTTHHRGGDGGSAAKGEEEMNSIVIGDEVWKIIPMPETGERRDILIAGAIFALSGLLLAFIAFMRFRIHNRDGRR